MAIKIFRKNNYIRAIDENSKSLNGLAKDVFVDKTGVASTDFTFRGIPGFENRVIPLADIQNEAGTHYTATTWEDFYTLNTGFNTPQAGGVDTGDIFHGGFVDYNDLATQTAPIAYTNVGEHKLTNDKAGSNTEEGFLPVGISSIWDTANNQFDFSQLKIGDMIDFRMAVNVTTAANNQTITINLVLGIGGFEYSIPFISDVQYKALGSRNVNRFNGIYIKDINTLNNPAEFRISSDGSGSVKVDGWYCKIIRKGI